ncbi:MAG: ATP-binding protein, partial [Paludibacteraceae bacterium]|nr:ATP-binding protein [Paludibacteraceae bacterium]
MTPLPAVQRRVVKPRAHIETDKEEREVESQSQSVGARQLLVLQKLEQFDFKNELQSIVIVGDCATGKTALACEIGGYALERRARVRYTTLEDLLLAVRNQDA